MSNTLLPGQKLLPVDNTNFHAADPTKYLTSTSGKFVLVYQNDGNLVVYDTTVLVPGLPGKSLWSTKTNGINPGYVSLQTDGNLVLYDNANEAKWYTGTWQPTKKGMSLVIQDDGNLVLYGITSLFSSYADGSAAPVAVSGGPEQGNGVDLSSVAQTAAAVLDIVISLL